MKSIFTKATFLILLTILSISCSKDESSSSAETNSSTITVENTSAKFTVAKSGVVKPNYIVMMFDQPFSPTAIFVPSNSIKQVTTDANGIANFDLNTIVTSTTLKKYYFEAFTQNGTSYTLKTNYSRFSVDLKKGTKLETGLIAD